MRKRIFKEFAIVMMVALIVSAIVFYLVVSQVLLKNTRSNLQYTLRMMDELMIHDPYTIEEEQLYTSLLKHQGRFSIIDQNGIVLMDTGVHQIEEMDNHLSRKEVQDAFDKQSGYAIRYSQTLQENMLYVAILSNDGPYVYRLSVPYQGIGVFVPMMIPAFVIVILVSFVISMIFSHYFSKTITEPLQEISEQMEHFHQQQPIEFEHYEDVELQNIVDTTDAMIQEIEAQLLQLKKEKKIRQEFFSNASHELKTPLTSIRGYMELLESGVITDPQKQQDFYLRIMKEADSMTRLINDILMISKLESLDVEVVNSPVVLKEICKEVTELVTPLANRQQVTLNVDCEDKTIITCYQHVQQILQNLISNAIKYNKENGRVDVAVKVKQQQLEITVEDTGLGIRQEDTERVFERFYRLDKGRSKKIGGTGLGLSIVKHIVQYHQGTIRLTSKVDVGTIITVLLPLSKEGNHD